MINHISIKNFAIIENLEIDFENGLNIITGETGSGKSIVVEAISLALGGRADSTFVRTGAEKAIVQLAGFLENEEIVITREVSSSGKNLCKLNGQLISLGELNETCKKLADIHGQYDNQSLLNPDSHIFLVDNYQNDIIAPLKKTFSLIFTEYLEEKNKLNKLLSLEKDNLKKEDFYKYEIIEINNANLIPFEDEELSQRISILENSEKIYNNIESAYEDMSDKESSVLDRLRLNLKALTDVSEYSKRISTLSEEFSDSYYRLEDICNALRDIKDSLTFEPGELDAAISRLDLIDNLKRKYGVTIEDILAYKTRIEGELTQIENYDERKKTLEAKVSVLFLSVKDSADKLTEARIKSAKALEAGIENELHDLNFSDAKLKIFFEKIALLTASGYDKIEILISTNKGEPMKPLSKIASGGEISRIMLAFKNVVGSYSKIPTMIFDEIDSGISGITASIVGKKLKNISTNHQIICITHLPQIAAYGDNNYRIYKSANDKNTFTAMERLTPEQKTQEIARLLGGINITPTIIKSAEELIKNS